ncbi:hypothetical protein [Bradyrhizobium sp. LTSPM299]|nr:hypothetical protein [Bradyrhizobium sp. LTSPM299]
MPIRKPLEIPPEAARQFAADMQAYHAEHDVHHHARAEYPCRMAA